MDIPSWKRKMPYAMILLEATVCAVAFFGEGGYFFMARKSRKHQYTEMFRPSTANAVGYVRLSVANQEEFNSIQNQKFIIERWGDQHQIPISIMVLAVSDLTGLHFKK